MNWIKIGENIGTYILVNGMTQLDFFKKARMSRSYIAYLDIWRNQENFKIIYKISKKPETNILEWIDDKYLGKRISMFDKSKYINELLDKNKILSEEDILKRKLLVNI